MLRTASAKCHHCGGHPPVDRQTGHARAGGKEARLTVAEAIRANISGAAYGIGVKDRIGAIKVGKLADLIVLDRNLFDIDPHEIHNTKVQLTMMDGVVRHRDGM